MKPKKLPKPTKKDKDWQEKVEKRTKVEKVELDHPEGKERFTRLVKRIGKKKS